MRFYERGNYIGTLGRANDYIYGQPGWSVDLIRDDYRDAILKTSFHLPVKKPVEETKEKKTIETLSEKD